MEVNKSSESTITITVSVSVELRILLEEGTQAFAEQCRHALEEELNPILGIGQARQVAPIPLVGQIAMEDTSNLTPVRQRERDEDNTRAVAVDSPEAMVADVVRERQANHSPGEDDLDAQIPPSQRRERR